MSIQATIRSQRTKAFWLAFAWAVVLNVPFLFLMKGVSVTPTLVLATYIYLKYSQGQEVVLWFRRFHTGTLRRSKFHRLLSGAVRGIGASVTIQDSSFRFSYQMRFGLILLIVVALVPAVMVCILIAVFTVFPLALKLNLPERFAGPLMIGAALVLLALAIWGVFHYVRRRAYVPLQPDNWQPGLDKVLSDITHRKGLRFGTVLVKCGDPFWQQAVSRALLKASAVIIDVSEMSENVYWELQTVLKCLPPRCVILAFPVEGETPRFLPEAIQSSLATFGDPDAFGECPLFGYPPKAHPFAIKSFRSKTKELREKLLHAAELRSSIPAESSAFANASTPTA